MQRLIETESYCCQTGLFSHSISAVDAYSMLIRYSKHVGVYQQENCIVLVIREVGFDGMACNQAVTEVPETTELAYHLCFKLRIR